MKKIIILAIETSCDETALSLVEASGTISFPSFQVKESIISSQIAVHRPFGGVVPNLAKREHEKNLPVLFKKLLAANRSLVKNIHCIAVTVGPGLEPALWAGITFAQTIGKQLKKPVMGVNHLEGHLWSFLLPKKGVRWSKKKIKNLFPAVGLIVSGGHTMLLRIDGLTKWKKIGETRDDAAGEAFDKVARLLSLPYPGGPEISKLAKKGDRTSISFPQPMVHAKNFDFSFSGLKTSVLYYLRDNPSAQKKDVAASFEHAAVSVLAEKTMRAVSRINAKSVLLSGGVAANTYLREVLLSRTRKAKIPFIVSEAQYNTDNASMVGAAAYINLLRKKKYRLRANGNLGI
ncbi:MAG: tRNA (adenosine(37)-N6)-threonylcarbamoyltransferase complex transferase subunit TsaD [Patescibacteria group bacterium]